MPEILRVLLNASALPRRPAGAGVYMLELAQALTDRPDLHVITAAPRPMAGAERLPVGGGSAARHFAWELRELGESARRAQADVLHGLHMFTPRRSAVPRVTTIHDLTFFRIPSRYRFSRRAYYGALARSARWAERVIVPSSAVAGDVVRYLGVAPAAIRVIPEAPRATLAPATEEDISAFRAEHGVEGPYFACLGTAEPGKRTVDAIRSMPSLLEAHPHTTLLIGGNTGPVSGALEREAARLGVAANVRFIGYVPDERLPSFLSGSEALIFPSLYEGFGLPPLEAMACGTPVIATRAPAMNEVLDGAALFVPTRSPADIAAHARRILSDPVFRADAAARGVAHARAFTWARTAELTEEVYREVAG